MELTLETKIEIESDNDLEITIESWLDDYRIGFNNGTGRVNMPLKTFDGVAAIVAKFRETNLILTGGKDYGRFIS